jgi:hypothetical protein
VAQRYQAEAGIPLTREPLVHRPVNEVLGAHIARLYGAAKHDPQNPQVRAAYDAFKRETAAQFRHLQKAGYQFHEGHAESDYGHAPIISAIRNQKRVPVYLGGDIPTDHPLAEKAGVMMNGKELNYNELFRAVHDVFGHAQHGVGFGPSGEDLAYQSHKRMYSPLATQALAAETKGQNSWVHYGPHARQSPSARPYAEQKATVLRPDQLGERVGLSRRVRKAAQNFSSPNTGQMNFEQAMAALGGPDHEKFRKLAESVTGGTTASGVGAWTDGAENSVVTSIGHDPGQVGVRQMAAKIGLAARQKGILTFRESPDGPDQLHSILLPGHHLDRKTHENLLTHGLDYHTLIPTKNGTHVLIYDEKGRNKKLVDAFARFHDTTVHSKPGSGEIVGDQSGETRDAEARELAAVEYRRILGHPSPEKPRQDLSRSGVVHTNGTRKVVVEGRPLRRGRRNNYA